MDCVWSDDMARTWLLPVAIPMKRSSYDHPDAKVPSNRIVWQIPIRGLKARWFTGFTHWVSSVPMLSNQFGPASPNSLWIITGLVLPPVNGKTLEFIPVLPAVTVTMFSGIPIANFSC